MSERRARERSVRVTVAATASRPPGRGQSWTVEAGRWRAEGRTEKDAVGGLASNLTAFLALYRPPVIVTFRGIVAVVSLDLGDSHSPVTWQGRIVGPDGPAGSSWGIAAGSWEEAEAHARHSLAQRSTDWHDDASVHEAAAFLEGAQRFGHGQYGPDELYRYAAWQRAAKAAIDAGREDWHEWATMHRAEFAVPLPADAPGEGNCASPSRSDGQEQRPTPEQSDDSDTAPPKSVARYGCVRWSAGAGDEGTWRFRMDDSVTSLADAWNAVVDDFAADREVFTYAVDNGADLLFVDHLCEQFPEILARHGLTYTPDQETVDHLDGEGIVVAGEERCQALLPDELRCGGDLLDGGECPEQHS